MKKGLEKLKLRANAYNVLVNLAKNMRRSLIRNALSQWSKSMSIGSFKPVRTKILIILLTKIQRTKLQESFTQIKNHSSHSKTKLET
jgi:hypothetical protein